VSQRAPRRLALAPVLRCAASRVPRAASVRARAYATHAPIRAAGLPPSFWFLNDLLTLGARRPLETQDLPPVLPSVSASQTYEAFSAAWEAEKRTASERKLQPSVYRALRASVLRDWWKSYLAFALASALSFAPPMLLSVLVGDFEDTRDLSDTQRWLVVCGLFVLPLMQSLLLTQHDMFVTRLGYKARSALTAAVYFKSLKLTSAARSASSSGAVTNLMSTDAASVILAAQNANTLWAAPVVVAVAMWLLYEQVGASAFVGIGFMFVLFPVNGVVFGKVAMYRRQLLAFSDQRVKLINEFFSGVRVVKMYAWEEALKAKITEIRDQELGLLYRMALLISIGFLFVLLAAPLLLPILVFVTYTKTGNDLDAAKAFTTISLFNLIRIPFSFLPMSLQFVAQAIASLGRIRNFLLLEELDSVNFSVPPCTDQELAIVIRQGHFRWEALPPVQQQGKPAAPDKAASSAPAPVAAPAVPNGVDRPQMRGSQRALLTRDGSTVSLDGRSNVELTHTGEAADAAFELRGVNLRVPKGVLCAVVGPFGSGKSSLLAAILGEMRRVGGEVHASGTFAYCAQQPWIFNGSLKNNVRFNPEKELNGALYDQALNASALRADLAQLHDGDETEIGERGINLSGGQKARVALARAIYSGADVVLIDDVLSAVDPHVAEHIFKEALCKALKGRTRVVVTNQIQFLPSCDYIVFLDRGQVAEQGRYDELMRANQGFAQLIQKHSLRTSSPSGGGAAAADAESDAKTTGNEADVVNGQREASAARKRAAATAAVTAAAKGKALGGEGPAKLVKDEERFAGAVSMNTYMRYAMAMGMVAAMVQWALLASDQVARIGGDFWLARFSDRFRNQASLPQSEIDWYIFIYLAWGLGGCVVIVVRSTMFAKYRIVASRRLHNTMLQRITWAPMR
jgi:ABC-type multidrug transport system fused ATPase/permease subunit